MALVFFGFFWFFLVFFGFFWHWFWPEFEIGNWFFLVFFGFFWLFLVFFGIGLGQHSKLETGFLGSVGFFWFFLVFFGIFWFFLVFKFRVIISSQKKPKKPKKPKKNQKKPKKNQKNPKKNQKKPVATPKLVNWLGFFWFFFGFFWGEHPPPPPPPIFAVFVKLVYGLRNIVPCFLNTLIHEIYRAYSILGLFYLSLPGSVNKTVKIRSDRPFFRSNNLFYRIFTMILV